MDGERTLLVDMLGSVLAQVDSAGNTTTSYTYDAYGGTTASGAASDSSYQYTSRENDSTGLYFYRARYYSPKLARFVSRDPIGFRAGANFYAYVNGDPVNKTDPMGLCGAAVGAAQLRCYYDIFGMIHCDFELPDIKWPEWPKAKTKTEDSRENPPKKTGRDQQRPKTRDCLKKCIPVCAACFGSNLIDGYSDGNDTAKDALDGIFNNGNVDSAWQVALKAAISAMKATQDTNCRSCSLCIFDCLIFGYTNNF